MREDFLAWKGAQQAFFMGMQGQSPFIMVIALTNYFINVFSPLPPKDTENDL